LLRPVTSELTVASALCTENSNSVGNLEILFWHIKTYREKEMEFFDKYILALLNYKKNSKLKLTVRYLPYIPCLHVSDFRRISSHLTVASVCTFKHTATTTRTAHSSARISLQISCGLRPFKSS
jgi:hypothetical protein